MGFRACIRDRQGRLINYKMTTRNVVAPVKEAEAMALADALSWLCDLGLDDVEIESDAKTVVDSLNRYEDDLTEYGDILN
ncbi:hypothetical protein LINPERHAP2_LOCUS33272 [Linum perenne]